MKLTLRSLLTIIVIFISSSNIQNDSDSFYLTESWNIVVAYYLNLHCYSSLGVNLETTCMSLSLYDGVYSDFNQSKASLKQSCALPSEEIVRH